MTKKIEEYIKTHYPTQGAKAVAEQLGISKSTVHHYASKLKVRVLALTHSRLCEHGKTGGKYKVDPKQFIEGATKETAYILGYLWADGSIRCGSGFGITLSIVSDDANEIRDLFAKTGKWKEYQREAPKRHPTWQPRTTFFTSNRLLHEWLSQHDYSSKSASPNKILSHIPESLRHYWWRGYFDGDGCLYLNHEHSTRQVMMYSEFDQDWEFAESLFERLKCRYTIVKKVTRGGRKSSCIRLTNYESCKRFCDYIYQGRNEDGMGLDRKHVKYLELIDLQAKPWSTKARSVGASKVYHHKEDQLDRQNALAGIRY